MNNKENNSTTSLAKKRLRFLERNENKFSQGDKIGLFIVVTTGLQILTLLAAISINSSLSSLVKKPTPTLVQLDTGKTITVAPLGNKDRTPQVVSKFVADTMILMMNWSGTKPPTTVETATKPEIDPGVDIRSTFGIGKGKVATAAWVACFGLSEDFRKEFLAKLAELTPSGIFTGNTQVALVPLDIQTPQKIAEGKWKVKMVANLLVFDKANSVGDVIPFNKEIFVQAVEAPEFPGQQDALAAVIYQQRRSGLEIYAIRDLTQDNL